MLHTCMSGARVHDKRYATEVQSDSDRCVLFFSMSGACVHDVDRGAVSVRCDRWVLFFSCSEHACYTHVRVVHACMIRDMRQRYSQTVTGVYFSSAALPWPSGCWTRCAAFPPSASAGSLCGSSTATPHTHTHVAATGFTFQRHHAHVAATGFTFQ